MNTQFLETEAPPIDLRLNGNSGYSIVDNRVIINIDEIANNRNFGDQSGTLAIELWALKQPYTGGSFSGSCLAATNIGEINGQHYLSNCRYDLCFEEPAIGTWTLCLMLREWTADGYVTRDFVNFDIPYSVSWKPTLVQNNENVVSMPLGTVSKTKDKSPAKSKAPRKTEVAKHMHDSEKNKEKKAHKSEPEKKVIALNEASAEDIAKVKGISKKLAHKIVDERPFSSYDQLLKVKGMGKKLLDKVRNLIKL